MPRYLVVANLTLGGEHLLDVLRERAEDPEARFHVLAPTSAAPDGFHMHDEEEATIDAHRRLKESMRRFGELGVKEVTGELGSSRPNDAIGDVIRANTHDTFDEIILSTLPAGPSKWIAMDLPRRVERSHGIPVTHLEAPKS
ncbi:MAG: hypothetical protein ABGZ36_04215 [Actinomycetota bacterium]|uniref:hypothetical protein n=1 Tax=Euzebya pacifica TaxID=1608957 RepID=UPI0030F4FC8D